MARFLMSPGVHIREIDQSQYAATTPTGNVAAIVGYAEKGPFEPTVVGGQEDFVQVFGQTLEDSPYLAQTAFKYLAQGSSALIIRAGDNRDPELYPSAAQYASKTIRLDASSASAERGYQEFSKSTDLTVGTFAPNTTFEADVIADHRAFNETKYLESWSADMHWTNANGTPVSWDTQPTNLSHGRVKIAMASETNNDFEVDYLVVHEGNGSSGQYYGTGTRTGSSHGSSVSAMVELYQKDHDYSADGTDGSDNTQLTGTYQAAVKGGTDFSSGMDWGASPGEFEITIGGTLHTVPLNATTTNPTEVVNHINTNLASAEDNNGTPVDLSSKLEAFLMANASGEAFICLKHTDGSDSGFEIGSNPFGWAAGSYSDDATIVGTWRSETPDGSWYEGNIILTKKSVQQNATSFVDPITVSAMSPATGNWTLSDIAAQIQSSLDAGWADYPNSKGRATATVDGTTGRIRLTTLYTPQGDDRAIVRMSSSGGNSLIDLLGIENPSTGMPEHQVGEALVTLQAAEKGSYGNKLAFRTETQTIQLAPGTTENRYNIYVLLDGTEVSVYQRVNWSDPTAENYVPTLLEQDPYIRVDAEDEDGNSTLERLPDGDWTLGDGELPNGVHSSGSLSATGITADIVEWSEGTNGYTLVDGAIDSMSTDFSNALKKIYNPEAYDFNLVVAPGDASSIVQNAIVQLCESRRDCFGIVDAAPFGVGLGIKNNINHVSEVNDYVDNLNSSYAGAYWPWLQDFDSDNSQYIWMPPSAYALAQMAYTDSVADPWFAAAGLRRGKVNALDVEYSPTRGDRDLLYGDTAIVNPIVKLVGEGIAIWGQKTAQRTKSATDRINVRRLLIYAEKLIANMARGFLFEPNDPANWSAFARQANAILEPIRQRRGLYQYQVICDESTNPPSLVNQNIMAGKIFLQPTKTIEFVEVSFTITSYGTEINEG